MAWYNIFMNMKEKKVIEAAKKLHGRLSAIHESDAWQAVWTYMAVHGMPYNGPTYFKEFQALEDAIWELKSKEKKENE